MKARPLHLIKKGGQYRERYKNRTRTVVQILQYNVRRGRPKEMERCTNWYNIVVWQLDNGRRYRCTAENFSNVVALEPETQTNQQPAESEMAKEKSTRQYMAIRRYDGVTVTHEWYSSADYQSVKDTLDVMAHSLMEGHEFECVVMPEGKFIRVTKGKGPTHTHIEDLLESEEM